MAFVLKGYPMYSQNGLSAQLRSAIVQYPIFCSFLSFNIVRRNASSIDKEDYTKYFAILDVPTDSDQECVRQAFLKLVKRFHPDSGSPEANEDKFHLIENAYRKLQNKFASDRWNVNQGAGEYGLYYQEKQDKVKEFDIQHTAPQHRQYLSFGGFGIGTPAQREKQYRKHRAQKAIENIHTHRISKTALEKENALVLQDKREAQKIKIRSEMDRLVEDLIQESMQKGDFDNLSGKGKPLKHQASNPYVDYVTHKMNQVLIENGFTPEWITLQKEISVDTQLLCESLERHRAELGPYPLSDEDAFKWKRILKEHQDFVKKINIKIDKYNLLVPLLEKQKVHLILKHKAEKILVTGKGDCIKRKKPRDGEERTDFLGSIFGSILSFLPFQK